MALPSHFDRSEFHWVVPRPHSRSRQQESQDLRVAFCRPAGQRIQQGEDENPAEQAVQEIERSGTQAHGEEKKLSLGAQNCERARDGPVDAMDAPSLESRGV